MDEGAGLVVDQVGGAVEGLDAGVGVQRQRAGVLERAPELQADRARLLELGARNDLRRPRPRHRSRRPRRDAGEIQLADPGHRARQREAGGIRSDAGAVERQRPRGGDRQRPLRADGVDRRGHVERDRERRPDARLVARAGKPVLVARDDVPVQRVAPVDAVAAVVPVDRARHHRGAARHGDQQQRGRCREESQTDSAREQPCHTRPCPFVLASERRSKSGACAL